MNDDFNKRWRKQERGAWIESATLAILITALIFAANWPAT